MPSTHKPRRRYVPKRIDMDTVGLATAMIAALTDEQLSSLTTPYEASFAAFREGRGTQAAWADLADALNVAEVLAELRVAAAYDDTLERAQAALAAVHSRHAERGSWTLYPAEITYLHDALWVHSIQLEHCSQGELADAILTVKRRTQQALAGNASPSAQVCVAGNL